METLIDQSEWEYFDYDGAIFRRPKGNIGGVTDVLHDECWKPYQGDRLKVALFGDRIIDPSAITIKG